MGIKDSLAKAMGGVLRENVQSHIRLETVDGENCFVLKDGSLMSLISLDGALESPGEEEIAELVQRLRISLAAFFAQPGHALEVTFMRDAGAAGRTLARLADRSKRAARNLRMDLDDVLDERERVLAGKMVAESCLIAVYTRPGVLTPEEMKMEGKALAKRTMKTPPMMNSQIPGKAFDGVRSRHSAFVDTIVGTFTAMGQLCYQMTVQEGMQEIRAGLYPDTYPWRDEWSPNMPIWSDAKKGQEKHAVAMLPETPAEMAGLDFSNFGVPTFDRQLATEDAFVENSRSVQLGRNSFSSFDMTLAPEILTGFNELVSDITAKNREIPWRASMRMESGGLQAMRLKSLFLGIFAWSAPSHNNRIRDALNAAAEIDGKSDAIVKFRMSFCTWAPAGKNDMLRRNAQILMGAVKRWGNTGVDGLSGDPLATMMSTVPGVTMSSTAPVAAGPMRDILGMMPIARQASPWDSGTLLLKTPSGKPWPFQPGSSKQTTWITILVGTPGSGKSVFLNAMNFASVLSPSAIGTEAIMPRIAIIDIGPSSSGLINLVRESLPADKRHLAVYRKLKMNKENAINVFDTPLGMRFPTSADRQFLANFISLICGDGEAPPSSPMRGLIGACIDKAYANAADRNAQRFLSGDEPQVDAALEDTEFTVNDQTTWWNVVDHLAQNNRFVEAELAQRHAVPTLADLTTASLSEQIKSMYGGAREVSTSETMIEAFQRMISEVTRDYAILSGTTRYSIGSARIVSLNLMDVTGRGSGPMARKQTALMYMLARQVMTRDFFLDRDEFATAVANGHLPEFYLEGHAKRADENIQIPKILCMDEFHRTGSNPSIIDQLMQDGREGRKFNVDLRIASQLIEDFPPQIVQIASGIIVCNAGNENSITYMDKMLQLREGEKRIMRYRLRGPSRHGAPIWVWLRMRGDGEVRQELNLTLGPVELWAYSTTAEDVILRNRLYEEIGPSAARQVLASRYPGGSAKTDIEVRVARLEETGERLDESGRGDVIGDLVKELKEQSFIISRDALV
jgi:intracellular multiplication protein IcmB